MKNLVYLFLSLICLFGIAKSKVKITKMNVDGKKCHGLKLKNCATTCNGIQYIDYCRVSGTSIDCKCL